MRICSLDWPVNLFHRLAESYPETNKGRRALVVPIRQEFVKEVRTAFWILLAACERLMARSAQCTRRN